METEGFFAQNTLFTRDEWLAFRQNRETKQSSVDQLLKYYVAKKRLIRVLKELYAVVAPGSDAAVVDVDPFVVCMKNDTLLSVRFVMLKPNDVSDAQSWL